MFFCADYSLDYTLISFMDKVLIFWETDDGIFWEIFLRALWFEISEDDMTVCVNKAR